MIVKYKVTDFAKDTGLPVRKILDTLTAIGVKDKKNSSILEEKELNALLDRLSRDNSEADLSAFLNSGKPEPKPAPAKEAGSAPKGQKGGNNNGKNAQPKAAKGGNANAANNNGGAQKNGGAKQPQAQPQNQNQGQKGSQNAPRKNQPQQPHKKRTKRPSPSASWPGRPAPRPAHPSGAGQAGEQPGDGGHPHRGCQRGPLRRPLRRPGLHQEHREPPQAHPAGQQAEVQPADPAPAPAVPEGQAGDRGRAMQRIQLEKARNAQLKVSIPDEITSASWPPASSSRPARSLPSACRWARCTPSTT